jgi:hypothetical protein
LPKVPTIREETRQNPQDLLPEQVGQRTEYPKVEPLERDLNFRSAYEYARVGWVIRRATWVSGQYVFDAVGGTFVAADKRTGQMTSFAVMRLPGDSYMPWFPKDEDVAARDWIAEKRP